MRVNSQWLGATTVGRGCRERRQTILLRPLRISWHQCTRWVDLSPIEGLNRRSQGLLPCKALGTRSPAGSWPGDAAPAYRTDPALTLTLAPAIYTHVASCASPAVPPTRSRKCAPRAPSPACQTPRCVLPSYCWCYWLLAPCWAGAWTSFAGDMLVGLLSLAGCAAQRLFSAVGQ